jgi:hypothetical protein
MAEPTEKLLKALRASLKEVEWLRQENDQKPALAGTGGAGRNGAGWRLKRGSGPQSTTVTWPRARPGLGRGDQAGPRPGCLARRAGPDAHRPGPRPDRHVTSTTTESLDNPVPETAGELCYKRLRWLVMIGVFRPGESGRRDWSSAARTTSSRPSSGLVSSSTGTSSQAFSGSW